MSHRMVSLTKLSTVAVALSLAACGGSNQRPASSSTAQGSTSGGQEYESPAASSSAAPAAPSPSSEPGMGESPSPSAEGSATTGAPVTWGSGDSAGSPQGASSAQGANGDTGPGAPRSSAQDGMDVGNPGGEHTPPSGAYGVTNPMAATPDVSSLNDAQLAAVVRAINRGEIQEGQLAGLKARAPEVKRFANHMVNQHREIQNHDNAVLNRLQITPEDNPVSDQLKSETQSQMTALQALRGHDFDRDYIDGQIRDHNKALELVDRIISDVKSTELKADLQAARPKIEAHIREAERVQQVLQRGSASK